MRGRRASSSTCLRRRYSMYEYGVVRTYSLIYSVHRCMYSVHTHAPRRPARAVCPGCVQVCRWRARLGYYLPPAASQQCRTYIPTTYEYIRVKSVLPFHAEKMRLAKQYPSKTISQMQIDEAAGGGGDARGQIQCCYPIFPMGETTTAASARGVHEICRAQFERVCTSRVLRSSSVSTTPYY